MYADRGDRKIDSRVTNSTDSASLLSRNFDVTATAIGAALEVAACNNLLRVWVTSSMIGDRMVWQRGRMSCR
jgi:hypothetical protein